MSTLDRDLRTVYNIKERIVQTVYIKTDFTIMVHLTHSIKRLAMSRYVMC